jgi:hypothetical protein
MCCNLRGFPSKQNRLRPGTLLLEKKKCCSVVMLVKLDNPGKTEDNDTTGQMEGEGMAEGSTGEQVVLGLNGAMQV